MIDHKGAEFPLTSLSKLGLYRTSFFENGVTTQAIKI